MEKENFDYDELAELLQLTLKGVGGDIDRGWMTAENAKNLWSAKDGIEKIINVIPTLTDEQKASIDDLVERYTPQSEDD